MDDDPLLTIEEAPGSSPLPPPPPPPRQGYVGGILDLNSDAIIPAIIATPRKSLRNLLNNLEEKRRLTTRSNSSPSIFLPDARYAPHLSHPDPTSVIGHPMPKSSSQNVRIALICLVAYAAVGLAVFMLTNSKFSGDKTLAPIDAIYFTVVTLFTVGYGDIVPDTTLSKLLTCAFILIGFRFIETLLNGLIIHTMDRQEAVERSGWWRVSIGTKVWLAWAAVVVCLAVGTVGGHFLEELSWVDSFYLSVMSVSTVGYGGYGFKTVAGRCFAVVWLVVSLLAVVTAFLCLLELRIHRRNQREVRRMLQTRMTLEDFVGADFDNDGCISKSDYIIYKLKEMGQIKEKDVILIGEHFDSLGGSRNGKITISRFVMEEESG